MRRRQQAAQVHDLAFAQSAKKGAHRIDCDLWELEHAIAASDANSAAQLFHPELLQGLFVSGASEFDTWMERERSRLRDSVLQLYWRAATTGGPEQRLHIERAIAISPTDEHAVRRGMRLLGASGDAGGALLIYDGLVSALHRELEIAPSEETRAIAEALRRQRASTSVNDIHSSGEPHAPRAASIVASTESILPAVDGKPMIASATVRPRFRFTTALTGALLVCVATIGGAAVHATEFGARDPRVIAVVADRSVERHVSVEGNRAAFDAAGISARLVRRAIEASNLFTVLDSAVDVARAGTVVHVAIERRGNRFALLTTMVDRNGVQMRADASDIGQRADSFVVDSMWSAAADRVASTLAATLYPGWGRALSQPPSIAAYRAFVAGMEQIKREEHVVAAELFLTAFHEDTTFTASGLLAGAEMF